MQNQKLLNKFVNDLMSESNIRELYVVLNDAYDILEQRNRRMMGFNSGFSNGGNSVSSGGSGGSECVGSYPVSGYTRSDGTEVSSYIRTCGAAHAGQSDSNSSNNANNENDWDYVNTEDLDEYLDKELLNDYYKYRTPVLEGKVEQNRYIHPDATPEIYNNDKLTVEENLQKVLAENLPTDRFVIAQDYYKISLDLANKPESIKDNERNRFYKVSNLPESVNKEIIKNKIAKLLKVDITELPDTELIKNMTVVIPKNNSPIVKKLKEAHETKSLIKKYSNDLFNQKTSICTNVIYQEGLLDLYGTLKKVDIENLHRNNDGSIEFIVVDYYDFEYLYSHPDDTIKTKIGNYINNNALHQQIARKLKPYIIYIPIKISREEFEGILREPR